MNAPTAGPEKECIVCGTASRRPLYPELDVVRCDACGFVFAETEVDPEAIYTAEYFEGSVYGDYRRERVAHARNFAKRLDLLLHHAPEAESLFEIGCAYGYFLEAAQEVYDATGIDISRDAVRVAREETGVSAMAGDYLDLPDPGRSETDIVCMWDVIEHLQRPDLYLEKAHAWLRPGGVLALTTGDVDSLNARVRGRRWRLMCPPHHLQYFSAGTLSRLLQRIGFEVTYLGYEGVSRTYRSVVEALVPPSLSSAFTFGGRLDFPFSVNLRDIMLVLARKRA